MVSNQFVTVATATIMSDTIWQEFKLVYNPRPSIRDCQFYISKWWPYHIMALSIQGHNKKFNSINVGKFLQFAKLNSMSKFFILYGTYVSCTSND